VTPNALQPNDLEFNLFHQKCANPLAEVAPTHVRDTSNRVSTKVKRTTYSRLAQAVLEFSLEHGLRHGDKIPSIRELAIIFGVSCPTIRCALTALEATGHLQKLAGIGSFLIDRSASLRFVPCQESSPLLILQACLTIEPEIAAEAARKCTPELLIRIRRQGSELRLRGGEDVVGTSMHSDDIRFHELVAAAGGRQIVTIIGGLWRSFYAESNRNAFKCLSTAECRREMLSSYQELANAIGGRDEWSAMRAMRCHLISLQELVRHGSTEADVETVKMRLLRDVA